MPYDTQRVDLEGLSLSRAALDEQDAVRIEQMLYAIPDLWHTYQRRVLKQRLFRGVTAGQVRLLNVLLHAAPCSVGTVATALNISMGAASESVDKLVEIGYITRQHSTIDRRQVILDLTDDAREIAAHARRVRIAHICQVFEQMEPFERDAFIKGLKIYQEVLAAAPIMGVDDEPADQPDATEDEA